MSDSSDSASPSGSSSADSMGSGISAVSCTQTSGVINSTTLPVNYGGSKVTTVWVPDDKVNECLSCATSFGITVRRHHCRSCGLIFCNTCSKYRAKLPAFGDDLVRICVECQETILAAQKGISIPKIRRYMNKTIEEGLQNGAPNKIYLTQKINEAKKLLSEEERRSGDSGSKDRLAGMNEDLQRMQEDLTNLRVNSPFLCTIVLTDKQSLSDPPVSQHRFLLISPGPARLLSISSLLYPASNVNQQIRFRFIRSLDEIQSIKPVELQVGKKSGKGIQIVWNDPPSSTNAQSTVPSSAAVSPAAAKSTSTSNPTTQFLIVDIQQMDTLEKVQSYMKKLQGKGKESNKRGSLVLRSEKYDLKLMDTLEQLKKNGGAAGSSKSSAAAAPANGEEEFWSVQGDLLATVHAHQKEHLIGMKAQMKLMDKFQKEMKTEVDWKNPEHADLLKRLWHSFSGEAEFPGEKSEAWKRIGFQGEDPTTDFRAMGLLALTSLVYAGEKYTADMQRLVEFQPHREYPLCTAGINLVSLIADLLTLTRPEGYERPATKIPLFRVFCRDSRVNQEENHFAELLANLLPLLDQLWVVTNATYFSFPQLFNSLKERMISALADNPCSFPVLIKVLNQEDLGLEDAVDFLSPNAVHVAAASPRAADAVKVIEPASAEVDGVIEISAPRAEPDLTKRNTVLAKRVSHVNATFALPTTKIIESSIPESKDED